MKVTEQREVAPPPTTAPQPTSPTPQSRERLKLIRVLLPTNAYARQPLLQSHEAPPPAAGTLCTSKQKSVMPCTRQNDGTVGHALTLSHPIPSHSISCSSDPPSPQCMQTARAPSGSSSSSDAARASCASARLASPSSTGRLHRLLLNLFTWSSLRRVTTKNRALHIGHWFVVSPHFYRAAKKVRDAREGRGGRRGASKKKHGSR